MIYPIHFNERRIKISKKNICIILNGSITIENEIIFTAVPSASFFIFDKPFNIIAASLYIEGFVLNAEDTFLNDFPEVLELFNEIVDSFNFFKIKDLESKKSKFNLF